MFEMESDMKGAPDPFELKVMRLALQGEADWIAGMRAQMPHLTVSERRTTGRGFMTDFICAEEANPVSVPCQGNGLPVTQYPPAINARRREPVEGLVSFIVWLGDDGRISQLEACSLTDDEWPDDPFSSFYDFQDDSGNTLEK
ncbi:hypothetical protein [Cupriavidus gilardii]|uniref:hypothetical protein n=1 Tax=Cupriavidus gilardii TaxID=82541 RepID=UPI0007E357DE|nr:hypothetical protein [Cupriavidus gilardii]